MRNDNGTIERKRATFIAMMVLIGFAARIVVVAMMNTNSVLPMVIAHNTGFILAQQPPLCRGGDEVQEWTVRVGETVLYKVYGTYLDSSLEAGLPTHVLSNEIVRLVRVWWASSSEWCGYLVVSDPWWFEYYWNHSAAMSYQWRVLVSRPDALAVVRLTPTS